MAVGQLARNLRKLAKMYWHNVGKDKGKSVAIAELAEEKRFREKMWGS
jgi:hypothetical protein